MKQAQLIPNAPRKPRRMLQPTKDRVRWRAELAEARAAFAATPRWWRLWHRGFARVVETDPETAAEIPPMEQQQ